MPTLVTVGAAAGAGAADWEKAGTLKMIASAMAGMKRAKLRFMEISLDSFRSSRKYSAETFQQAGEPLCLQLQP
jgi:hypothetical protein